MAILIGTRTAQQLSLKTWTHIAIAKCQEAKIVQLLAIGMAKVNSNLARLNQEQEANLASAVERILSRVTKTITAQFL